MIAGLSDLRMERDPLGGGSALFSACGKYRYVLERQLQPRPEVRLPGYRLVSCGLNPSTADAFKLDRTTEREVGYALDWGCETYVKINAKAWRTKSPKVMHSVQRAGTDVVGPSNDVAIEMVLTQLKRDGGILLASWGAHLDRQRALQLIRIAHDVGVKWQCIGLNVGGSPVHPLTRRKLRGIDGSPPALRDWLP